MAASCAAILTVYGSGYWRTRAEARRYETDAQSRPARPALAPLAIAEPASAAAVAAPSSAPPVPLTAGDPPAPAKSLQSAAMPAPTKVDVPVAVKPEVPAVASVPIEQASEAANAANVTADAPGSPAVPAWRDGYYTGWGTSPHGDIEAKVTIKDGKIVDAGILTCATRYPCYVIDTILNQPVVWQSPDVDRVSRATESADAYYWGLVQALKKAELQPTPAATSP
ncbi:MAG: hypothetical protein ABIP38_06385 [Steroidobacteraceae bacterium]